MKRITDNDIQEMRSRGYDAETTVSQAHGALERNRLAEQLMERIATAFHGVVLGGGIGLQQAQGLDDYDDEATCAAYRAADEKDDWRRIAVAELNRCNSSLSFFDAEGMRSHLPAYMTAELLGDYHFGMSFCLTHLDEHGRSYFTALDSGQRSVVRDFLLFLRDDPDYEFDNEDIDRALTEFWTDTNANETIEAEQGGGGNSAALRASP